MARIFGWNINRNKDPNETPTETFAAEERDDGASILVDSGIRNTFLDMDGAIKSTGELITRYRELSLQPEIEGAIDDIVNEMIAYDEKGNLVEINLDTLPEGYSARLKKVIAAEYQNIINMLDFNHIAYELVRRWYIDGRLYYYTIIDLENPQNGLREMRYIDPRRLRKVRVVKPVPAPDRRMGSIVKEVNEYYLYSETGFTAKPAGQMGYAQHPTIKISADSMIDVTSGLMDPTNTTVLSYLHKANKPLNQLRAMEDATVINKLVRAPIRRVFQVEIGSLPKAKGEQYLRDQMVKYKSKLTYDASTGAIKDNRHYMTMLEDYWFAKRNGNASTTVENIAGGDNFSNMDDLNYFLARLYRSLNVPVGRMNPDSMFAMGRPSEITRDELKFSKFIGRLRLRFSKLLSEALKKQLILKNIVDPDEADKLMQQIVFDFKHDVYFAELKDAEIFNNRVAAVTAADPFVGKYFSRDWMKRKVLHQSDDDIEEQAKEMAKDEQQFGPPMSDIQTQQGELAIQQGQQQVQQADLNNQMAQQQVDQGPAPHPEPAAKEKPAKKKK